MSRTFSHEYGNPTYTDDEGKHWYYCNDDTLAISCEKPYVMNYRPCPKCKKMPTEEGYDSCLGHIEGAKNACCGHGIATGFIMYEDGRYEETTNLSEDKLN